MNLVRAVVNNNNKKKQKKNKKQKTKNKEPKDGKAVTFIDMEENLALTATTTNLVECSPLFKV